MMKYMLIFLAFLPFSTSVRCQETVQSTTVLWDASYSMINRDLNGEFAYLNAYFQRNPNTTLTLVKFSNEIILVQSYVITQGKWLDLKKELKNTVYDGGTKYNQFTISNTGDVLLFSDGYAHFDQFPKSSAVVHTVCGSQNCNRDFLKEIASRSKGTFIDLSPENKDPSSDSEDQLVERMISDEHGILSDVTVISKYNGTQTVTDGSGNYTIEAKKKGILEFRYMGKNTVLARVPVSGKRNIYMTDGNLILDELLIEKSKEELINNGFSTLEKKRLGYSVSSISGASISPVNTNVRGAVIGRFAGVEVARNDERSQFLGRGKNTTIKGNQYGLIVLDGVPLDQSNSATGYVSKTNFINPENIESITYLKGLAATNIYGTQGSNGVLLIKSKTASSNFKEKRQKQLGNTPFYDEDATIKKTNSKSYMNKISKTTSIQSAYEVYLAQRKFYGKEMNFFFDMASYFKNFNTPYLVKKILSNVLEIDPLDSSLNAWKALAFKYDEFGMHRSLVDHYKKMLEYYPEDSQTYRNLALSYRFNGEFLKAQDIYNKIYDNQYSRVRSFSGLQKTINTEYKNLVFLHDASLNFNKIPTTVKNNESYNTRIIFEWSQYSAEFDLQIVNPQKRYYTWSHTKNKESARFDLEKLQGHGLEEFFITSKDKGDWLFNMSYYGKQFGDNTTPTYLKITVFKNFGKPNQSRKITNLILQELNKKETVLKLTI